MCTPNLACTKVPLKRLSRVLAFEPHRVPGVLSLVFFCTSHRKGLSLIDDSNLLRYFITFLTSLLPYFLTQLSHVTALRIFPTLQPYLKTFFTHLPYALTLLSYVTALRYGLLRHDPGLTVCLLAFYGDITWALRTPYTRPCLQGRCLGLRYGS